MSSSAGLPVAIDRCACTSKRAIGHGTGHQPLFIPWRGGLLQHIYHSSKSSKTTPPVGVCERKREHELRARSIDRSHCVCYVPAAPCAYIRFSRRSFTCMHADGGGMRFQRTVRVVSVNGQVRNEPCGLLPRIGLTLETRIRRCYTCAHQELTDRCTSAEVRAEMSLTQLTQCFVPNTSVHSTYTTVLYQ